MLSTSVQFTVSLFVLHLNVATSIVWLRNPNERGPTAVNAGTKCLCAMAKYYFYDRRITRTPNLGYFHSSNLSAPSADIQINFLIKIHSMIADDSIDRLQIRVLSDAKRPKSMGEPRSVMLADYFVFIIDNITKFHENLRVAAKSPSWNPGARILLLINNPNLRVNAAGNSEVDVSSKIFEFMYNRFNVARVVILYASGVKTYNVYITNPYKDEKDCKTLKPILIDECDDGKFKHSELTTITVRSPKVPTTVPACTFTSCTKENEPYIDKNCTSGLELDIMRIVQDVMKFKTRTICSTLPRGEPNKNHNGSWSGLLGLLRNDGCDFVFGGFFPDNEVHEDFAHSSSYFEDTYTWYIHFAPLRPRWKGLLEIFQSETWLLLFMTLFVAGVSWFIFGSAMSETNSHKKLVLCMMNSLAVLLGISSNNRPNYSPLRIFFILLALYGLNVTTIYTSKLIMVFTQPAFDHQITTIQEILDTEIPIGGQEEFADWFENDNPLDQIISKKYNNSERFKPTLENMKLVENGYISILSNRIYVLSHDLQDNIFALPGNVFSNPLEMITERGFPLIRKFNKLINLMKDAGLTSKTYNDFLYNNTVLDFIRHRERLTVVSQITLTLDHLQGAFAVLIVGLIFSFVILAFELIGNSQCFTMNRKKIQRRIRNEFNQLIQSTFKKKPTNNKLRKRLKK